MNRRSILTGAASLPVLASGIAAATLLEASDPHMAWADERKAIFDRIYAPDAPELDTGRPELMRMRELDKLICTTPAKTCEGAAAQLEFALSDEANFELTGGVVGDLDGHVLHNILATLKLSAQ